ncbi:Uncharacterized protein dnm_039170 [Desulfonema magnum]|uniref:Uncharacterized protein n=1 Tax=Desulfonema magnum TaxID=45655 RepID=A0A975BLR4_9BACT|nr:Uncharacterized protein dnm_039170 [Desulfonema magnum]
MYEKLLIGYLFQKKNFFHQIIAPFRGFKDNCGRKLWFGSCSDDGSACSEVRCSVIPD